MRAHFRADGSLTGHPVLGENPRTLNFDSVLLEKTNRAAGTVPHWDRLGQPAQVKREHGGPRHGTGEDVSASGPSARGRREAAHPACAVEQGVRRGTANPLLRIHEIDKSSNDRRYGSIFDTPLAYLERDAARQRRHACAGGPCDPSQVPWVLLPNDLAPWPAPLRSRFHVIAMEPPAPSAWPVLPGAVRQDLATKPSLV